MLDQRTWAMLKGGRVCFGMESLESAREVWLSKQHQLRGEDG